MTRHYRLFCSGVPALAALAVAVLALSAHAEQPATAKALGFAPKEAQVAIALPAISESLDAYVALVNKVAPNANIQAKLAEAVAGLAAEAKVDGAASVGDVLTGRGLDPAQPVAAFLDFSKSVAPLLAAQKGGADAAAPAPEPAPPAFVIVAGVKDQAKAEALLKELGDEIPGAPAAGEEVEKGDVVVHTRGDYGHFFSGDQVFVGTKDLVVATAGQVGHETKVRYGGKDLPAGKNEVVALVFGDRFFPILDEALPSIKMDDTARQLAAVQVKSMKDAFASSGDEDPLVVTLSLGDDRADLSARLDTTTHPGYLTLAGPAKPLRLAPLLPENTLAMISLRLNDEMKKQISEQVIPAVQSAGNNAAVYATPAVQMIGDEITIGIAAVENDFPAAYIMVGLQEPEAAKGLLNMLVPTMPAETYNSEEIKSIAAPIPVPLAMATPGDMLLVSNNIDGMKKIIDLKKAGGTTKMLQSLKDPMKADTPTYQALVLKSSLLTDVVVPLTALGGGLPPNVQPIVDSATGAVEEVRMTQQLEGNWSVAKLTAYLK